MTKKSLIATSAALLLLSASLYPACTSSNNTANQSVQEENYFSDVNPSDWFFSSVKFAKENGLMKGTDDTNFSPHEPTTRGMIVTILWRLENEMEASISPNFSDVKKDAYYHNAVAWAYENKIVSGYSDMLFGPEDCITREQLAAIFYRYASFKKYDVSEKTDLGIYKDASQISDYAIDAISWANSNGIITGTSYDTLSPHDNASRCQVAAILERFYNAFENAKTTKTETPENVTTETNKPTTDTSSNNSSYENNIPEEDINLEKTPTISISDAVGMPGDTVQVLVKVQNNPGILGMVLNLKYDESAMKLLSAQNGEAVSDSLTLTPSKALNSGTRFVWDGLELEEDDIKDGTLLTLEFELLDNSISGKKYPLELDYSAGDIIDNNLNEVNPRLHPGSIEIKKGVE